GGVYEFGLWRLAAAQDGGQEWENMYPLRGEAALMSFNGCLLIADGREEGLVAWDTENFLAVPGSPPRPTVLGSIADRVITNSLDAPDYVFFSGPQDFEDWSVTDGGAAVDVAAGFGEGMEVNGFAVVYSTLIVSKLAKDAAGHVTQKRLHMINTEGTPSSWSTARLSSVNAACVRGAITTVQEKAYFLDSDGIKSAAPSIAGTYGDIAVDPSTGVRIHAKIGAQAATASRAWLHWCKNLGQLWFIITSGGASSVVLLHPMQGMAWTEVQYPFDPGCMCEVGKDVYLGAADGSVYRFTGTGKDEGRNEERPVYGMLRSRKFGQMGGDLILRGAKLTLGSIQPTRIKLEAVGDDGATRYPLAEDETLPAGSADDLIFTANYKIYDAEWFIGGQRAVPKIFDWKTAGPRDPGLYLQLRTEGGRVTVDSIQGLAAVVG
ncbi:MAG: hypothetical protein FWG59_01880, partial [Betaproteobacteria bacterium]|nr:hypothetical protein [Betaproteobacteria bacterium]